MTLVTIDWCETCDEAVLFPWVRRLSDGRNEPCCMFGHPTAEVVSCQQCAARPAADDGKHCDRCRPFSEPVSEPERVAKAVCAAQMAATLPVGLPTARTLH